MNTRTPVPEPPYDAVMPVGPGRAEVARSAAESLRKHLPIRKLFVVGSRNVLEAARKWPIEGLEFVDEDGVAPGMPIARVRKMQSEAARDPNRAGWYFQQFLKMGMALHDDVMEHYLVWDSDTVLLRPMKFFTPDGKTLITIFPMDMKGAHRDIAMALLDQEIKPHPSFIREQMMFRKTWMKEMLERMEATGEGKRQWPERIMDEVLKRPEQNFGFSEFEAYGSFIRERYGDQIRFREIASERQGARKFGLKPNRFDLIYLARDFDYASFESWSKLEPDRIRKNKIRAFRYALRRMLFGGAA